MEAALTSNPAVQVQEDVMKRETEGADEKDRIKALKDKCKTTSAAVTRKRNQLMATTPRPGLETTADYSPIRNPRDGDKLGSA